MHGFGIPTTRSLAIVASDLPVYRERAETAALLVRVARSHVRFGSFQLFASRQDFAAVQQLADHVIDNHFPELLALSAEERYAAWFRVVVDRTARLMAEWTAVGFAHGVMNTDNMSILGITLDYGPFGWLDQYDPTFICNHSDSSGRYAFDQQPRVGLWNCARLGEALLSLVPEEAAVGALESYRDTFETRVDALVRAKLGLVLRVDGDPALVGDLFDLMHRVPVDYTCFFRLLSAVRASDADSVAAWHAEVDAPALGEAWLERWLARVALESRTEEERRTAMEAVNPKYVLRNWIAQEVIEAAVARDTGPFDAVMALLRRPFDEHPGMERYAAGPPEGTVEVAVSCSS
jgi:serine/tyrosine/threonine adenylyltransferase